MGGTGCSVCRVEQGGGRGVAAVPRIKLYPSDSDAPQHQVESFSFSPLCLQITYKLSCFFSVCLFVLSDRMVWLH